MNTTEMYGEAEPLVDEAIAGGRDPVFLGSKVLSRNTLRAAQSPPASPDATGPSPI